MRSGQHVGARMKRDLQLDFESATPTSAYHWRYRLLLLAFCATWVIAWYASTLKGMADIWTRNETFAHGYIVPLVSLWLAWRHRHETVALAPRVSWWAMAALPVAGFAWLLGELAAVNAISQLAFVTLLVLTVIAVLGRPVAQTLAFPLAFLFFAVPIGEILLPWLMTWTADFTVAALRLTGIPVYREGQQLVIPSGVWSVVEACSGLRYLIASFMVGTLFAHLMYRSLKRRLIFVGLSILVPIIANWLRAYMIVMIGHVSGNKLAVGVDHLIYGWLFFAVVIACLFAVGARWRQDDVPSPTQRVALPIAGATSAMRPTRLWSATAALLMLTVMWKLAYLGIERSDASSLPELHAISSSGAWIPVARAPSAWQPHFVNPSSELQQTFRNADENVSLFLTYYRNQTTDSKAVGSDNKLVRSDDPIWLQVRAGSRGVELGSERIVAHTAELRHHKGEQLLVWQWYWINGRVTGSEYSAKSYIALSRLMRRGDDSAAVVVYALQDKPGAAERKLDAFVRDVWPAVESTLRQTRDRR
jgi:exosortase A